MGFVYQVCQSLSRGVARLFFDYTVIGEENFEDLRGAFIVAPNHASYLDPPVAGIALRTELNYLARNTLYSNPFARWLFPKLNVVPVDQDKAEVAPLKTILRLLKAGKPCLIFPEGGRSKSGELQPGEPGVGFVVAKAGVPVVPMRLFGAWEALPPGSAKLRFPKITVVVGQPIYFQAPELKGGKEVYEKISLRIMEAISRLQCPPERVPKTRAQA